MLHLHDIPDEPLTAFERRAFKLLREARAALWREWVDKGSEAARQAFDNTEPGPLGPGPSV
jgi:hypothetical protein